MSVTESVRKIREVNEKTSFVNDVQIRFITKNEEDYIPVLKKLRAFLKKEKGVEWIGVPKIDVKKG